VPQDEYKGEGSVCVAQSLIPTKESVEDNGLTTAGGSGGFSGKPSTFDEGKVLRLERAALRIRDIFVLCFKGISAVKFSLLLLSCVWVLFYALSLRRMIVGFSDFPQKVALSLPDL